jgi:two-component system chemotaxis response regulator CheB
MVEKPLNMLFSTAAEIFKHNAIGVLLTGIGDDGADGFARIRDNQGNTIAQDSQCCVYPNLTHNAIARGTVGMIVDETQLPDAIAAAMS